MLEMTLQRNTFAHPLAGGQFQDLYLEYRWNSLCTQASLCSIGDSPRDDACDQHSSFSAANTLENKKSTIFKKFNTFLFLAYKNKKGIIWSIPEKLWQLVQ